MEILLVLFTLLFGGCVQSCAAPNNLPGKAIEKVTFTLPAYDENFPSLDCWEIKIVQGADDSKNKTAESNTFFITENAFTLNLSKNKITAVSARPVTKNSFGEQTLFFYQAGTVYPNLTKWNGHNAENMLTWEDGFTAKVIELIYGATENSEYSEDEITDFIERFNWKKFSEVIFEREEKSAKKFYNPWQIDLSALIEKLLSKDFNANAMNTKEIFALPVEEIPTPKNLPPDFEFDNFVKPISPYVPENDFIKQTGTISIPKNSTNRFLYNENYALLIKASQSKKVSTEIVFLPKIVEVW